MCTKEVCRDYSEIVESRFDQFWKVHEEGGGQSQGDGQFRKQSWD